ncbi:MAG: hypothetical protein WCU00_00755 [Candidatus Latescibacterota bacterium]
MCKYFPVSARLSERLLSATASTRSAVGGIQARGNQPSDYSTTVVVLINSNML